MKIHYAAARVKLIYIFFQLFIPLALNQLCSPRGHLDPLPVFCVFSKFPISSLAPSDSGSGSLPLRPRSMRRCVRPRVVRLHLRLQSPLSWPSCKVGGNHAGQPCNQIFKNSDFSRAAPPVEHFTFQPSLARVAKIRVSVSDLKLSQVWGTRIFSSPSLASCSRIFFKAGLCTTHLLSYRGYIASTVFLNL